MKRLFVFGLFILVFYGCKPSTESITTKTIEKYTSKEGVADKKIKEEKETITLAYDFGVLVQPVKEPVYCEFEIKNDTLTTWNLKEIINSCSCTVADITSPKIEPGKLEKIKIIYKPVGNESFDDTRKSFIMFTEDIAPNIVLYVKSKVREPMTVMPKSLSWMQVGKNQSRDNNFEIQNYSEREWKTISLTHKPDWLQLVYKEIPLPQDDLTMRQRWLANIKIETKDLMPREYRDEIVFDIKETDITKHIPVVLQICSSVSVVPSQIFFGEIKKGVVAEKSIKVFFNSDSLPKSKEKIHFEHHFGKVLHLNWLSSEGETWELQASLKLEEPIIPEDTSIIMTFDDPKLPEIVLPVYVFFTMEDK